jgi:glycosyltransferase involved in cell wall biosynthesis
MTTSHPPRLAVISPFLDKRHGSERIVVEWLSHLPGEFEIHLYSQRVENFGAVKFTWHRIPKLPGPHLLNFLWWLIANRLWVGWDSRVRGLRHDIVFSSGANRSAADVVCVHIVFPEYVRQASEGMRWSNSHVWFWPRLLHRKLYYWIAHRMEQACYRNPGTTLVTYSAKTVTELRKFFGRRERIPVLYLGLDHRVFDAQKCASLRQDARAKLGLSKDQYVLLLVGNDWRNKGVPVLLEALQHLRGIPVLLYVVSREHPAACQVEVKQRGEEGRVRFLAPRGDIEFYYAAADAYVGPSLQDSFALPPAEAMACGLPVIVSARAGVSEIVTDGVDGLILRDPGDASALAAMIRRLYEDRELGDRLGRNAAETMRQYTWERNGRELAAIFEGILQNRVQRPAHSSRENDRT